MNRKRMIRAAAFLMLAVFVLAGCRSERTALEEGKVNVVASFFPLYDFAREIGGEHVHVLNLIPAGVEPHDWAPRSRDMTNVAGAQMFVYQGAGFEGWTDDLLGGINQEHLVVVEASRGIELIPTTDEDGHDHDGRYDPHTWLSPKSALKMAENVKNGLLEADPGHSADYERNYEAFASKLEALDAKYTEQLGGTPRKEIVVTHQAFGYLTRDYALTQLPLMGVAAEAEPTAQDLKRISEYVKKHRIRYIFTEALVSDALPKTLARDLHVETLQLHPLEGLTEEEQRNGESYISLMEVNLANLVKALSDAP